MMWTVAKVDAILDGRRAKLAELVRRGPAGEHLTSAERAYIDRLLEIRHQLLNPDPK